MDVKPEKRRWVPAARAKFLHVLLLLQIAPRRIQRVVRSPRLSWMPALHWGHRAGSGTYKRTVLNTGDGSITTPVNARAPETCTAPSTVHVMWKDVKGLLPGTAMHAATTPKLQAPSWQADTVEYTFACGTHLLFLTLNLRHASRLVKRRQTVMGLP